MKDFLIKHQWGILTTFLVGLICILPQLVFIVLLGDHYRGIHMSATPNEIAYMGMMQEILDGYPKAVSVPFLEYKNNGASLLPVTVPFLYVLPVWFLHISISNAVVASKFILPALLFFVIYLFFYELSKIYDTNKDKSIILYSITLGLLIIFGFDFVDYNTMMAYLSGRSSPQGFLIWTRPANPIAGAILLFLFLICLLRLILTNKNKWIFGAGIILALMMVSYVFSWTIAAVILGVTIVGVAVKKFWLLAIKSMAILPLAFVLSLPYWLDMIRTAKLPWYREAAARIGLYYTHMPHLNKFIICLIILFFIVSIVAYLKKILTRPFPLWWWMGVVLLLSCFFVYNQQVITGREIWYYHYVFYTIPLGYTVILLLIWHLLHPYYRGLAKGIILMLLLSSIILGIFQQTSAYVNNYHKYYNWQDYQTIFNFLNQQAKKDSVVLINSSEVDFPSSFLLAYTHCNLYFSGENQSVLANPDDFYFRYLVLLRTRGVTADNIEEYITENNDEVANALQYQLQRTLGFPDLKYEQRLAKLPIDYRTFLKKDFHDILSKFRIDYIISTGELNTKLLTELPGLHKMFAFNGFVVYKLE